MTYFFLDASAIIKRYLTEQGSNWVIHLMNLPAQNIIILSEITMAEVAAGLARRRRAPNGIMALGKMSISWPCWTSWSTAKLNIN